MKSNYCGILMFLVLAVLILPNQTLAQDASAAKKILDSIQERRDARFDSAEIRQENRAERVENRHENRAERVEVRQENRAPLMDNLQEARKERIEVRQENRAERIENRKEALQTRLEQRKQNVQERRARLSENTQERVSSQIDKIFEVFDSAIARLQDFSERISEKISKKEASGENVGELYALLDIADMEIENAVSEVSATKSTLNDSLSEEIGSGDIRDLIQTAKDSIRIAHQSLVDVVNSL